MRIIGEVFTIKRGNRKLTVVGIEINEDVIKVGDIVKIPLKNGEIVYKKVIEFAVFGHMDYALKGDKIGIIIDYILPEKIEVKI